jgi:hypothetical protein
VGVYGVRPTVGDLKKVVKLSLCVFVTPEFNTIYDSPRNSAQKTQYGRYIVEVKGL